MCIISLSKVYITKVFKIMMKFNWLQVDIKSLEYQSIYRHLYNYNTS